MIGFRASSSGDLASPGGTTTIAMPTGSVGTDVVVAIFGSSRIAIANPNVVTPPAGWTSIASSITDNNGVDEVTLHGFWSLGNNASLDFSNSQTLTLNQGWVALGFTGVDNGNPIDSTGTPNSNSGSASLVTNAINIVVANSWHCIGFADWLKQTFNASSFTNVENGAPATNQMAGCFYNTTPKAVGSTGTVSISYAASGTSEVIVAMPFALRPAYVFAQLTSEVFYREPLSVIPY